MASARATGWNPGSILGPGVVGKVAIVGAVVAGAAIVEAALIPGLLIGGAAVLAPTVLPTLRRRIKPLIDAVTPGPVTAASPLNGARARAPLFFFFLKIIGFEEGT